FICTKMIVYHIYHTDIKFNCCFPQIIYRAYTLNAQQRKLAERNITCFKSRH
ncbi:hypothetical protein L9F63_008532, partial [Diploptera punctata]